jgi:hypothetical protein
MSNISLSSIPQSLFWWLDEKARRRWDSLSLAEQAHEIEKAKREQLAWKESPVREWWCGEGGPGDELKSSWAAIQWWMKKLAGVVGDPDKSFTHPDDVMEYCCAELGMSAKEFGSKTFAEIAERLKTAYEKKVGLEPKAEEKPEAGPAAKPEARKDETAKSGKVIWQEAAERMERLRAQGEPWTSQRKLADQFGCSSATINKAISETPSLTAWASRTKSISKAQSLTPLGRYGYLDIVTEDTPQKTEADPAEEAASRELRQFIENADPETRAWFHGLQPKDQLDFLRDPDKHKRILGRKP